VISGGVLKMEKCTSVGGEFFTDGHCTALFTDFSSILRYGYGRLLLHIKCAAGEDFCKIVVKSRIFV
jgi:hypothetical protein